jgi:hypothetical protein
VVKVLHERWKKVFKKNFFLFQIAVKNIERYPSHLLLNIIQKLGKIFDVFKKAHEFIKKDMVTLKIVFQSKVSLF